MAYDLQEQESIDQMKAWWDRWGTPVTAAVCVVCLGFAGWNGWNWYKRNQAAEGVKAAEGAFHPKLFAFGQKNLIKHYLTLPEPDWIAGIGVTFTLWSQSARRASLRAAEALVTKADAAHSEVENALRNAVEVAFLRVTEARHEYRLTESTVALARENLRLREKSFAEGLSTALDLNTARSQLTGAEIARRPPTNSS